MTSVIKNGVHKQLFKMHSMRNLDLELVALMPLPTINNSEWIFTLKSLHVSILILALLVSLSVTIHNLSLHFPIKFGRIEQL